MLTDGAKLRIVVCEGLSADAMDRLRAVGSVTLLKSPTQRELADAVRSADALIVRTYTKVTADILSAAGRLKVIGRAGVGLDAIDVQAARDKGITVVYTPAAATQAVAEHTVGMILALERYFKQGESMIRAGRFAEARGALVSRQMDEVVLGIVGMGRIGSRVGRICHRGFGTRIIYNDIVKITGLDFDAAPMEKDELYATADVVTLHVPLTTDTHHLIDETQLALMKSSTMLINTSRGSVVNASDLAHALRLGRVAGAALDVHESEPPPVDYPLLDAPNVILTPHIAARTTTGLQNMNDVVNDVIAVLQGKPPRYPAP